MITLLVVGTNKEKAMTQLQTDYVKRINHFHKIQVVEVKEAKVKDDVPSILSEEADHLMKHIKPSDKVIVLSLEGKMIDSLELSTKIDQSFIGSPNLTFIIGGSWGLAKSIQERADFLWKISDLTFPHLLCRIIVLEQIYRSFKILNNQTYHK